jgi:hypothetical protein
MRIEALSIFFVVGNPVLVKNLQRETASYLIRPYTKEDKDAWLTINQEGKHFILQLF